MNKTIGYAFDQRNPLLIATKRIMQEIPLFSGRVNERTNSLSPRSADVITLNTLVEVNKGLLDQFLDRAILTDAEPETINDTHPGAMAVGKAAQPFVQERDHRSAGHLRRPAGQGLQAAEDCPEGAGW